MEATELYGAIAEDLPRVEETIRSVSRVEYPWLASLAQQVLSKSGKRMRPAMTLLAGRMFDYDLDLLVPMAASVELLHTATLVHDDTLDAAFLRRGTPTVNRVWNDNIAVLFGDYLFAASAEMVSRTANVRVMRLFAQTLMVICSGELSQHFVNGNWRLSRDEYYQRIRRKTASLFSMAAESGAVLGGAPEPAVQAAREYGYHVGTAFQIMDDILDLTGEEEAIGKPVGSDLSHGTLTLPAIMALERDGADNPVADFFEKGRNPEDLARAVARVREGSVLEDAYAVAAQFSREACRMLETLPPGPARRSLEALAAYALDRTW